MRPALLLLTAKASGSVNENHYILAAVVEMIHTATLIHDDVLEPGQKVLIVDDLLATGGTAEAGVKLIERAGAEVVGCAFVIDLPDLGGRKRLEALGIEVHALCAFEGE